MQSCASCLLAHPACAQPAAPAAQPASAPTPHVSPRVPPARPRPAATWALSPAGRRQTLATPVPLASTPTPAAHASARHGARKLQMLGGRGRSCADAWLCSCATTGARPPPSALKLPHTVAPPAPLCAAPPARSPRAALPSAAPASPATTRLQAARPAPPASLAPSLRPRAPPPARPAPPARSAPPWQPRRRWPAPRAPLRPKMASASAPPGELAGAPCGPVGAAAL